MRIIKNNEEISVEYARIESNINGLARFFTIMNQSEHPIFNINDDIEFYHNNELFLTATLEYINLSNQNKFTYMGRNKARLLIDSEAPKTYQFSESQDLKTIIEELIKDFEINIEGSGFIPLKSQKTVEIGDNLGESIVLLANNSGQRITSDAYGNLIILEDPIQSDSNLEYGENVLSRRFTLNSSKIAEKYIIISQSDPMLEGLEVNRQGFFGDGNFTKIINSPFSLNEEECQKLSEFYYNKNNRENIIYIANIDPSYDFSLNNLVNIKDSGLGLNQVMKIFSKKIIFSKNDYRVIIGLQKND